jgi:acyl dehydratase
MLTVQGKIAAILPRKAGTLVVIRFDAHDKSGNAVFTEHNGALLREVVCKDAGRGNESLPERYPIPEGRDLIWSSSLFIDRMRPFLYDGCTDIVFPIHTSKKFARDVGLPDIILQGTATLAYAMRELCNREGGGDPGLFQTVSCRFSGMVFPGSHIRIELIHKTRTSDGTHLHFRVKDEEGRSVVSDGHSRLRS